MKKWLLLFIGLTAPLGAFAQVEKNTQWYQSAVHELKLQPKSFGRDTLLIDYYYQLMLPPQTDIQSISTYLDSMTVPTIE